MAKVFNRIPEKHFDGSKNQQNKDMMLHNFGEEYATEMAKVLNRITSKHFNGSKNPQNKDMMLHSIV